MARRNATPAAETVETPIDAPEAEQPETPAAETVETPANTKGPRVLTSGTMTIRHN